MVTGSRIIRRKNPPKDGVLEPWDPSIQSILFVEFFFAKVEVDFHDWHFFLGVLKKTFFLHRDLASIYMSRLKLLGVKTQQQY